jgi:hypothetical protein
MTLLVLGAILWVRVVIARELRLLRRQRESPANPAEQRLPDRYKPRIFTFGRSGWKLRILDLEGWVLAMAGAVTWWKFILPELPAQPWIKYSITIAGFLIWVSITDVSDPLRLWNRMDKYDERVYKRVLSPEEREEIAYIQNSDWSTGTDVEEMPRILKERGERIERLYRAKGL